MKCTSLCVPELYTFLLIVCTVFDLLYSLFSGSPITEHLMNPVLLFPPITSICSSLNFCHNMDPIFPRVYTNDLERSGGL